MDTSFLDFSPKKKSPVWIPVKVTFIGGERYRLISVDAEARIDFVPGGFETKFRKPFAVPSELLLGSSFREATVHDIEIELPGMVMSMAQMYPKSFPRLVREGQTVGVNP